MTNEHSSPAPPATLAIPDMIRDAQAAMGGAGFSELTFMPALTALVKSLNEEAKLNALGVRLQRERLTELLKTRLRLEAYIRRYPEILDETLTPPVVILSLPRTGTTMLQRLLSTDDRFIATRWYEVRFPVPDLDWDFRDETDSRIPMAKAEVAALIEANPGLLSIHPLDAMAADEDLLLLEAAFLSSVPGSQANIPGYNKFYERDDALAATRYHKKLLQCLQWQRRRAGHDVQGKPWLLKSPAHMYTIEAMRAVYPDARFITSHRNPLACIPSISSFYFNGWVVYSDDADPRECGKTTSRYFSAGLERARAAAGKDPDSFLDFEYEDLINQQDEVLAQIYAFLGWPLTPAARAGIEQYRKDNPRNKRKPHDYSLEQFGLTESQVKADFAGYFRERGYG